jgi:hypothetical protein
MTGCADGMMQQGGKEKRDTSGTQAIQMPYLRVVGIEEEVEGAHSTPTFTCVLPSHT